MSSPELDIIEAHDDGRLQHTTDTTTTDTITPGLLDFQSEERLEPVTSTAEATTTTTTEQQQQQQQLGAGGEWIEGAVETKEECCSPLEEEEVREGPTNRPNLEVIEGSASAQFARLVRGWERYVDHGTRHVQRGLQNLAGAACGEDGDDLFAPIVLRHTHSSPLNYSSMFLNSHNNNNNNNGEDGGGGGDIPPPTGLEHMRRSSSTPSSSSAFRERSAGSAFGTNLRTMPHLTGPDDRSAFTLPMQRRQQSASDSGVRYSAFNPVSFSLDNDMAETEKTSIEVMDMGSAIKGREKVELETQQKWPAASKAKKFLKENVLLRRRHRRRGGRENPARPASNETSPKTDDSRYEPSAPGKQVSVVVSSSVDVPSRERLDSDGPAVPEEVVDSIIPPRRAMSQEEEEEQHYHQLDSDIDEEFVPYQRIETVHDSPGNVPSPSYHRLVDGAPPTSAVRIQVSGRSPSHPILSRANNIGSPHPAIVARTPSQDSGADSPGTATSTLTSNTSGHTTLGTSTSGTVSSGRTALSVVSETDREVMETNKTARNTLRFARQDLQARAKHEGDGDATVHSSSTTSTTTHGYLALSGSPGPLRDGANVPSDRFFKENKIPISHSASSNSGESSSTSSDAVAAAANNRRPITTTATITRDESQLTTSTINPFTGAAESQNTSSSSSSSDAPPQFVSYLDRQSSLQSTDTAKTMSHANTRSSPPVMMKRDSGEDEERSSPAQIVGYSQVVFEAAKPEAEKLFRPVKKRDPKFSSRPPLSPIKGLRAMVTPPPNYQRPDSTSPGYQQLSPPNIVDHRVERSEVLSKPYVLRSNNRPGMVLVSPERASAAAAAVPEETINNSESLHQVELGRYGTYRESNIEVEKEEPAIVSPEKAGGESA